MARTHATRQVAAEQHQQLIAEHGATLLVHRADAIAVAVEGDPSSALSRRTVACRSRRFSTTVGSG